MYQLAAARVVTWRREHGDMSQVAFAKLADVSVGCLQSFEAASRRTRASNLEKIAKVLGLTTDQLLAEDVELQQQPNELLKDLLLEDLRMAQRFHHAGAEVKHAMKAFLTAPMSEEHREQVALLLAQLVSLDQPLLPVVETILTSLEKDGPATTKRDAPELIAVSPPGKKNG
jgi:transcriptional regulator with XRE-family HTH domain